MSEKDVYIGETSIQIGEHGFINQPKEIIEYIKYLQKELQQKENIIKEVREYIENHCKNEIISNEVGYACYTMADTNELEHIIKILGDNDE